MHLIRPRRGAAALICLTVLLGSAAACSDAGKALEDSGKNSHDFGQDPGNAGGDAVNGISITDAQNQAETAATQDGFNITDGNKALKFACGLAENSYESIKNETDQLAQNIQANNPGLSTPDAQSSAQAELQNSHLMVLAATLKLGATSPLCKE